MLANGTPRWILCIWTVAPAVALIGLDVALTGGYLFCLLACPFWLVASIALAVLRRPGWRLAIVRGMTPVATLLVAVLICLAQDAIASAKTMKIVRACDDFHTVNGAYPETLNQLVPDYLPSIPIARFTLCEPKFHYATYVAGGRDGAMIWFSTFAFGAYGYDLGARRWRFTD